MIVLLLIIVIIVIVIVIVIAIIKQIAIINGMIMGTMVGGDKSFGRQKTEDRWVPLPFTPPLGVVFLPHVTYGMGGLYLLVIRYAGSIC